MSVGPDRELGELAERIRGVEGRLSSKITDLSAEHSETRAIAEKALEAAKWDQFRLGEDTENRGPIYSRLKRVEEECRVNTNLRSQLIISATAISAMIGGLAWIAATAPGLLLRVFGL